jgi:hypothetical protein
MNTITPRVHGYLDYVTVVVLLLAPTLIGLTGFPAQLAYALAGIHLVMTLATDCPFRQTNPIHNPRLDRARGRPAACFGVV